MASDFERASTALLPVFANPSAQYTIHKIRLTLTLNL